MEPIAPRPPAFADQLARAGAAGLAATVALLPLVFVTFTTSRFELTKVTALRIGLGMVAGLATAVVVSSRAWVWRRTPLDLPVLAWMAWLLVKSLDSVSTAVSWRGDYGNFSGAITQLHYGLLFFLTVQLVRTREQGWMVLRALERAAIAAALFALIQATGADPIRWPASALLPERYFGSMGNPNFLAALVAMVLPVTLLRIAGVARGREGVAAELRQDQAVRLAAWVLWSVAVPLAAGGRIAIFSPGWRIDPASTMLLVLFLVALTANEILRQRGWVRGAATVGLCVDAVILLKALVNTGSRGALAAFVLAGALLLLMATASAGTTGPGLRTRAASLLAAGLVLFTVVAVLGSGALMRRRVVEAAADPLAAVRSARFEVWKPALGMWLDHPLTGVGTDAFEPMFPRYAGKGFVPVFGAGTTASFAHCEPLHVLATLGVVGLLLWGLLLTVAARQFVRVSHGAQGERRTWLMALAAMVTTYLLQNLLSFGVVTIQAAFWCALGLLFAGEPVRRQIVRGRGAGAGVALVCGLAIAAAFALPAVRVLIADGHAERATRLLEEGRASLRRDAGDTATALGRFREAARHAERSVSLVPTEVRYHSVAMWAREHLAARERAAGRLASFRSALAHGTRSLAMNPEDPYLHANLGRLWSVGIAGGIPDAAGNAEREFGEAIRRAPSTAPSFYLDLARLHAASGRPELVRAVAVAARRNLDRRSAESVVRECARMVHRLEKGVRR